MTRPRVLFVSVNPFSSTSNNGKTFASFFEGYAPDSIAQLYFHREIPTSSVCDRYFRITDEDLLQNAWRPWRVTGSPVTAASRSETPIPERVHTALKGSSAARVMRQLLWTGVRLENPKLLAWLDDFAPDIVFFCGGDAASLYPKVARLADRYGARLVFYITDDYVLPTGSPNPATRAMRRWTRREFTRLATRADLVLTIGESMSSTYERTFGIRSVPVMNMVAIPDAQPTPRSRSGPDEPLTLLYAGSLHSNRWQVLSRLAERVEYLVHCGVPIRLLVFGPEPSAEALRALDRPPFSRHGGLLNAAELSVAIAQADVLLHVEADDAASMEATALSISTKIPEYLASGRPILAIGPRGLASLDYLVQHDAAIVLEPTDTDGLDGALRSLALEPALSHLLASRAFALAQANHEGPRTRRVLWNHLDNLVHESHHPNDPSVPPPGSGHDFSRKPARYRSRRNG